MSIGKLATALTVIFAVSVLLLVAELLFVLRRRRSSHLRSSQPPVSGEDHFLTSDCSAKQLLYAFCLKSQKRVEPSEVPTQTLDGSPPRDDPMIDVFKLLESNGPSRFLCTIKEDDREDVESISISGVESVVEVVAATESEKVTLQAFLESEAVEERGTKVNVEAEGTNTVFSSPCDSPMFFTPMGSPSRDGTVSEFVSPVNGKRCDSGR